MTPTPAPLICVHDPAGDGRRLALWAWPERPADAPGVYATAAAETRAALPGGWRPLCAVGDRMALLRALGRLYPGRDVILVAAGCELPDAWWPRLSAALEGGEFDVVSCLDHAQPELDPGRLAPTLAGTDALCWHYGEHALFETDLLAPGLSAWRAVALTRLPERGGTAQACPSGLRAGLLPALCVDSGGRHPQHDTEDRAPLPVRALRTRVGGRALAAPRGLPGADGRPVLLHVLHGWGGGVERFVRDLATADERRRHLVLRAESDPDRRLHGVALALHADLDAPPLARWPLAEAIADSADGSREYRLVLDEILERWGIGAVLVSSLIGHGLDALRTGLPTAVCIHDAYPLWPWLDAAFASGERFDADALRERLAHDPPALFRERSAEHWLALREAWLEAIAGGGITLVAPSQSARRTIVRLAPALERQPWQVIGHGLETFATRTRPPGSSRRPLRVLVPGRIGGGKGERLLERLVPALPDEVELVLLGAGAAGMRFLGARGVHLVQDYRREALPRLIEALAPDLALLPSTAAETWSYTLSEMWALGVPVLATRRGSFAERIEHGRTGLLVEPEAEAVGRTLSELAADAAILERLRPGTVPGLAAMAEAWRQALPAAPRPPRPAPALAPDAARRLQLQIDLDRSQSRIDELERRIAAQRTELDARAEWAQALEAEAGGLRAEWAASQARLAEARQRLEALIAERDALRVQAADLETRLASAYRLYDRDSADLAAQRDIALAQRDQLQAQFAALLRSHSWRLTAPLRVLRRGFDRTRAQLGFRWRQARNLGRRVGLSLRRRGWRGTLTRIRQEWRVPARRTVVSAGRDQRGPLRLPCPERPRASVVVPAYNQVDYTLECLRALANCGDATPFEVIVVDDHSDDDTPARLAAIDGLRWHRNERNLGFIGACNAGALLARGEFLVFLNNDTRVRPGWLDALIDTFAEQPRTGLVGSKLIYPDGRLQEAGALVFADGSGWNIGRFENPDDPRYGFLREVDYCSGAAIAIRRELFTELGGFDPRYAPAYYEDTDLAMKVRAHGLKVFYQPRSEVVHCEGVSHGTDPERGIKAHQVRNQALFLERWRDVLERDHPPGGQRIERALDHRARKRVLVVDACTPTPDRDSGSLRMVNLLRLLREEGCTITFFADNRAHDGPYTEALQRMGVEVWWHPHLGNPATWLARHGGRYDIVVLSRHYVASAYLPLLRQYAPQATVVFDTVDLHYLREQREAELNADVRLARRAAQTRAQELAVIAASDLTLVVSPHEQRLLARELPEARVEVLSNVHAIAPERPGFEVREGLLFVGGFRHPPNVDGVRWFVDAVLPLIRAKDANIELHVIGADAPESIRALAGRPGVRFHGHVPDIAPYLGNVRVAVAPLRYGAGVKGKINLSMAHGQPVVATGCAVEGMHLADGEDVLVADTPEAFAAAVLRLYRDPRLWQRLAENGVENVRRHFSFDAARRVIRQALIGPDKGPRRPHLHPVPSAGNKSG